jgi:hypothetical protein
LSQTEMTALIGACDRLRDRFLLNLLKSTGLFSGADPLRGGLILRVCAAQRLMIIR